MRINPITNTKITFGTNKNIYTKPTNEPHFEKSNLSAIKADAVQSNFFKALGCKIKKAYNILTKTPDIDYIHIPYMA